LLVGFGVGAGWGSHDGGRSRVHRLAGSFGTYGGACERLPALLRESLKHQEDITEALGVQVRQAVELLVAAFARAGVSAETPV
jgi:hypothetical protein